MDDIPKANSLSEQQDTPKIQPTQKVRPDRIEHGVHLLIGGTADPKKEKPELRASVVKLRDEIKRKGIPYRELAGHIGCGHSTMKMRLIGIRELSFEDEQKIKAYVDAQSCRVDLSCDSGDRDRDQS